MSTPADHPRRPLTVIGGYLGAGKTTLVNHLLRHVDGLRLAVLVNDFGSLPIDEDLIESRDNDMISIAGGCVCCSYGSDMIGALMDLSRLSPGPDHVLLETSGVALPDAVAQSVQLLPDYRIDATVVVCDGETIRERASDTYLFDTVLRQLRAADIILLNKTDMIPVSGVTAVQCWLARTAPEARILRTVKARVPPMLLIGAVQARQHTVMPARHLVGTPHCSVSVEIPNPVDAKALARALADPDLDLVRAKGLVFDVAGTPRGIQVVGRRWQVEDVAGDLADGGRVVCIRAGVDIDRARIIAAIERCAVSAETAPERQAGQQADQMG